MIYLDWAATAPPIPAILNDSTDKAALLYANPSSVHAPGKAARECIEQAREACGRYLEVSPERIYFTAGGTESNNIVLTSLLSRRSKGSVVISGIEHPSVYEPAQMLKSSGFAVRFVKAETDGIVDPDRFAAAVESDTVLAAVMLVNNETGAIQPVAEVSRLVREKESVFSRHVHLHTDAVQGLGKMKIAADDLGIDSLAASGHKLGAPRGAGILYLSNPIETIYRGGGQEQGQRPGTENLGAVYGLGTAFEMWETNRSEWSAGARALRSRMLGRISTVPGVRFFDPSYLESSERYSPYIMSASFPPVPGEVLVRVMSDRGFAISTGSACSARGKKNPRVLENMGAGRETTNAAVRVSIGPDTTESECDAFCTALEEEVTTLMGRMGSG